jgi:hypothetical protein
MLGNYQGATQLLASGVGLSFIELVREHVSETASVSVLRRTDREVYSVKVL